MNKKFVMGNEAIAFGAIKSGVNLVAGYPGTPSTEILETVAKNNSSGKIYVEWSVNEKAALEVGAGAAYAGARVLITMKQVGLNVASDPLMSLAYVGVKGGMVIVSADDPGPISSQTEQDTRHFAEFSKLPCFDPSSPDEAFLMIQHAFEYSEKYQTPVLFRPTTRVCHGCSSIDLDDISLENTPEGFIKDSSKWVIFPRLAYENHLKIEKRNEILSDVFSNYKLNIIENKNSDKQGIATGGISYAYTKEALAINSIEKLKLLKISTPYPFPEKLALEFLENLDEVLVVEELDGVIENALIKICGKYNLKTKIKGKFTNNVKCAGENTVDEVSSYIIKFCNLKSDEQTNSYSLEKAPVLPIRPPVLCAGCPHRASFYAVKKWAKDKKAVYSGDIGCYTLGNAMPLDMVDTCLCMGAGITVAQGLHRIENDTFNFAFIGDSTFFASGITGVINAVYNKTDIIVIILDNSTTAMTGHQPHPGTGKTMMGDMTEKISIENILKGIGVSFVKTVNPLNLKEATKTVEEAAEKTGVRVIIFKSPCIAVSKVEKKFRINKEKCINCKICIKELGCPAISVDSNNVIIDEDLCYGCSICQQICPKNAIEVLKND